MQESVSEQEDSKCREEHRQKLFENIVPPQVVVDFINEGLYQAIARGNEWRTILLKEYECTMMATMFYVREGCRHTHTRHTRCRRIAAKGPCDRGRVLESLSAANHMSSVLSYTPSDATCKVPLVIANLSPMLHQIAWCEARVARADVSIVGESSARGQGAHVTFHAETIDRLVRQAVSIGNNALEQQVVQVCKKAFKRCFDQIAQTSIDALVVSIATLDKAAQDPQLQAAKAIEADKMPEKAKLAKLSKSEPAKAFAKAFAQAEVQLNQHEALMKLLTGNAAAARHIDTELPPAISQLTDKLRKDEWQAARQLLAELAVVQGIFVDIPDGAKRFTLHNAAKQKVKDIGATLTTKVEM